ncbi:hypothetical protein [Wolbachia endosymbiont (group E) of Neria commutata]|uniref:hypothetical protein n=1 Tax=Wolbachia endosymbiont (group E) of Neria commutata TaxID=3066149 RepID=UPI003132E4BE
MITETSGTIVRHAKIEDGKGCTGSDRRGNLYSHKSCSDITVKVPHILPSHANIKMNKTNADTTKLARTASIISGSIPANAQMLGLPQWSGKEYEYQEGLRPECLPSESDRAVLVLHECITKVPYYSENPEAIYPFYNAFVIANRAKMANHNKNQTILFDLRYVNSGTVVGNNERKSAFLVHGGHAKIFGGNGTQNVFHLLNKDFSGRIYGGDTSNVLDLSGLNGPSILYEEEDGVASLLYKEAPGEFVKKVFSATKINGVIGSKDRQEYIDCKNNEEMFINSEGGYESDEKDFLMNCKKAVIWPYTKATGGDGNYVFYIKPSNILESVGRSEIDVSGNGTLVFPETALLKDCRIIYSRSSNTLSFEIPLGQNKTFVLEVRNYLNEDKPKFHLIDKHGSNIVPIIEESESKEASAQIKSFRLNAEKEAFKDIAGDEAWYISISESRTDYQVLGVIKDKESQQYGVFGRSGIDVINLRPPAKQREASC